MIIEVERLDLPELAPYLCLADGWMRTNDIFVAESPKVIERALKAGFQPLSLMCEGKHITGDASSIINRYPSMPVYTGNRETLASITGYTLTRGVLCAMQRPAPVSPDTILHGSKRICVIYDICDATNIGVIFRSAAALGMDGILLSPGACDPLNRRAIRVSMGTVFQIPWSVTPDIDVLMKRHSFITVGTALTPNSMFLQNFKVEEERKYALVLGSEGYGLPKALIDKMDYIVKIPMHNDVDSLNVGAAAAIFIWHFCGYSSK